jgi:Arylsulfatase A and related enzymes
LPVVRNPDELQAPHPVFKAFHEETYSLNFSRDEVRERVVPTYMGLIKQIDDHLGRVFEMLKSKKLMDSTLYRFYSQIMGIIWVITGWGRKTCFTNRLSEFPLIVCDPENYAESTRGTVNHEFVRLLTLCRPWLNLPVVIYANSVWKGNHCFP